MRTGGGGAATGGLRILYETFALVPRLGMFADAPHTVPYDYDELIGSLAPMALLLYAPNGNRFADAADVATAIRHVNASWAAHGAAAVHLEVHTPQAPSQMRDEEISVALDWVERLVVS